MQTAVRGDGQDGLAPAGPGERYRPRIRREGCTRSRSTRRSPARRRRRTGCGRRAGGRAVTTDGATGKTFEIAAGDVVVQPKGWSGHWDVKETIRKVYSIGL
ncbi:MULTISPECIES: cupin domain-containing protein [Streptomyces]|uniref:cupin domain-containing protein n=1 Tax=Streptomyces TaxID=1883 RepID=UPI001F103B92|nr:MULTISPECIES: cupin domain-containing protein [Streptomyces]